MAELPPLRTFYGVQVLRGVAALMVTAVHVTGNLTDFGWVLPTRFWFGNFGVDLFFLISGFVIVWTTQNQWWQPNAWRVFLDKRLTRVLPLYWILTTVKVVAVLALPFLFRNSQLTPWLVTASYLLIPARDAVGNVNPIIDAGWTLCFEMAFYYICTLCLFWRRRPLVYVTPVLIVLGLFGIVRPAGWNAAATLISPLLLEFAAGMWMAELARRDMLPRNPWLLGTILVIGLAALIAGEWLPTRTPTTSDLRVLVWGVPSVLILYAVLGLESRVDFRRFRLPLLLGSASYSIYLSHVMILPALSRQAAGLHLSAAGQWVTIAALIAVGTITGVAVWWLVERKVIRILLDLTRPLRALVVARGKTEA